MTPEHMTNVIRTAQRVIRDHYTNDADPGDTLTLLTQALGLDADVLRAQAAEIEAAWTGEDTNHHRDKEAKHKEA